MSRPRGQAPKPHILDKEKQVLALRRQGKTWEEIAFDVGYKHPSGAAQAYERACVRTIADDVNHLRNLECERLDLIHAAIWEQALTGDLKAIDALLKVMTRRAKLLGLDTNTRQPQIPANSYSTSEIESELAQIIRATEKARSLGINLY